MTRIRGLLAMMMLVGAVANADNRDNFTGGGGASGSWEQVSVSGSIHAFDVGFQVYGEAQSIAYLTYEESPR